MVHYNNHKKKEREEKLNQTNQRPDQRFSRISPKKKKQNKKKHKNKRDFGFCFGDDLSSSSQKAIGFQFFSV